jgi:cytochrome b561
MSKVTDYNRTAVALHWLLAAALVASLAVGFYMVDLSLSPFKLRIYSWHKWAGVTIFLLVFFRLAWRLVHGAPHAPAHMPAWQQAVATHAHRALYVLMLAIPVSGWLMSSAKGFQTVYFGVLPLPDLLHRSKELGAALASVHEALNFALLALVLAHAAAAIKHHLVDRDEVLARMLPFLR